MTRFSCTDTRRLTAVKLAGLSNGIEYVEVRDHDEPVHALRQRTLFARMLLPVPVGIDVSSVVIDGGERVPRVGVDWAMAASGLPPADAAAMLPGVTDLDHVLVVRTVGRGDFTVYRFALVTPGSDEPPAGFDPLLAEVPFSFKVECPNDFDCDAPCTCPPGIHHPPTIDYLAKDYQGFRRIMLERMALLAPDWTERSAADVGVALVELLAYVADELSYRQDAVATESYLGTARSRVSLKRHARLVDYRVHDGCNARVWARLRVAPATTSVALPAGTRLLSSVPGLPGRLTAGSREFDIAMEAHPLVFTTVDDAVLHGDLDELRFWTWGGLDASLAAGSTEATLRGFHPALRAGEVIVLAETVSPTTRAAADADPGRRFPVRLVEVRQSTDPAGALFPDGVTEVTEIRWTPDDALPASLCLRVEGLETARAWGNIVLADHGEHVDDEPIGTMPAPRLAWPNAECDGEPTPVPARFRPRLANLPVTMAVAGPRIELASTPLTAAHDAELATRTSGDLLQALFATFDVVLPHGSPVTGAGDLRAVSSDGHAWLLHESPPGTLHVLDPGMAATAALATNPGSAVPAITLIGAQAEGPFDWYPLRDLLGSRQGDRAFVVECEHDGTSLLRFGDGAHGMRPVEGTRFTASYRVGNGVAGNIGHDSLTHVVSTLDDVLGVTNPLPAAGGVEPESGEQIRRGAPATLAVQERAVTPADYEAKAQLSRTVARAAATFRWTGSWHTVFVTADRVGGAPVDRPFETALRADLERYRMAGYDLEVDGPRLVPITIGLHICVAPGHHRADVSRAVRVVLSNRMLPDGRLGMFHPDRFTFGQPVYLSAVLAAVHSVPGVQSVDPVSFERQRLSQTSGLEDGVLPMGRLEVARLDQDPNFPERGVLELTFGGGS